MGKILIVDDNEDVLQIMQLLLSSRGYQVQICSKGGEAFDLIKQIQPALIFLDIHLSGGIDGRIICKEIKTFQETKHIPVILFSANIIKGTTLDESLADDFVAKPFDIHELLLKVNKLIGTASNNEETMIA